MKTTNKLLGCILVLLIYLAILGTVITMNLIDDETEEITFEGLNLVIPDGPYNNILVWNETVPTWFFNISKLRNVTKLGDN